MRSYSEISGYSPEYVRGCEDPAAPPCIRPCSLHCSALSFILCCPTYMYYIYNIHVHRTILFTLFYTVFYVPVPYKYNIHIHCLQSVQYSLHCSVLSHIYIYIHYSCTLYSTLLSYNYPGLIHLLFFTSFSVHWTLPYLVLYAILDGDYCSILTKTTVQFCTVLY